jgi:hypothetical protein
MTWTRRFGALLLLAALCVAPALAWRGRAVAVPCRTSAAIVPCPSAAPAADTRLDAANGRTGIGVELEVLSLRIELAWFDAVPVSPGRRIVFSWLANPAAGE